MCLDCDSIIEVGNTGYSGYTAVYANVEETCDGNDVVIQQLVGFVLGSGPRPSFDGNLLTDAWLAANPLYLGENGWTDVICDATNLLGPAGSNGSTGSTGAAGEDGVDGDPGCDPDITITATVEGSDDTYDVTVTRVDDPLTPCTPEYNLEFPVEIFSDSAVIDAVDEAVTNALTITETLDSSINISTGNSSEIKYTLLTTISGTPSLSIDDTYDNWINSYIRGNEMTVNFRINLVGSGGVGLYRIEMLIPSSKTSKSTKFANSIGYFYGGVVTNPSALITTNSSTGNTHLKLGLTTANYADVNSILIIDSGLVTLIGQITFLIN